MGSPKGHAVPQPVAVHGVTVSISVTPADAKLLLDGVVVTNPYSVQRPSDQAEHTLVAEASGYAPLKRNVQFERDLTVVLALAPLPPAVAQNVVEQPPSPSTADAKPLAGPKVYRKARASTAEPSSPPVASKPNCSVPYTIDGSGIKTYKPECL
jgi:hypothetical protein